MPIAPKASLFISDCPSKVQQNLDGTHALKPLFLHTGNTSALVYTSPKKGLYRIFWFYFWQVSQTNVRRPLISKRRISLLQLGHCFFAKIFTRSLYRVFDGCASSTVIIAFCLTPIVRSALASSQIWSNVCRLISLPGVSGWTDCRHRISDL